MIQPRTQSSLAYRIATVVTGTLFAAVGLFGTANFAHAAALTSTNVQPASLVAGASGQVTITFTTTTTIPANGRVEVVFPNGFDVSSAAGATCSSMDGTFQTTVGGQTVRIIRQNDGTGQTAGTETCTINGIVNPTTAGSTSTYTITTMDNVPAPLDQDLAVSADTITAATLTSTNVQPASTRISTVNTVTVTFTTVNSLEANGKIVVTFPAGFNVSGASAGTCSTMDGTFATAVSTQTVTITRSGGSSEPAGAQTCTLSGIRNPVTAGSGGTYDVYTTNSASAIHDRDSAVTADTFSTSSSSSTTTYVAPTYNVAVSAPVATAVYMPGDDVQIAWSTGGTGMISAINLAYSTDGGLTWTSIATGTNNDSAYTWTAPDLSAQSVTIRVEGTDLVTVLATDDSDAFSIGTGDDESGATEDTGDESTTDDETEVATLLPEGTFIKGASWSTVYYVDADGTRRPFLDSQTFYSYADNFDGVVDVSDDYLSNFTIGTPMLPKAGTVLVKIQSVDKVYALGEEGELHWVTSESLATSLYGSSWADYVIDVPVTAWSHFTISDDITSTGDWTVDSDLLQTRSELNSK